MMENGILIIKMDEEQFGIQMEINTLEIFEMVKNKDMVFITFKTEIDMKVNG